MKNETKEILKYLANNNTDYEEDGHTYKILELDECKLLSDYIINLKEELNNQIEIANNRYVEITKLQEENERLKEINKEQANHLISKDNLSYEDYKSRNEKAIEYNDKNIHSRTLNNILRGENDE